MLNPPYIWLCDRNWLRLINHYIHVCLYTCVFSHKSLFNEKVSSLKLLPVRENDTSFPYCITHRRVAIARHNQLWSGLSNYNMEIFRSNIQHSLESIQWCQLLNYVLKLIDGTRYMIPSEDCVNAPWIVGYSEDNSQVGGNDHVNITSLTFSPIFLTNCIYYWMMVLLKDLSLKDWKLWENAFFLYFFSFLQYTCSQT